METRAYSLLQIKAADEDAGEGIIRGIASTPSPDRADDVVVPEGATFTLPLPLLWQHNSREPIGHVTEAKVTKNGIEIVAKVALGVTDEIDRYWKLIRAGLVRGLSIGFRGLEIAEIPGSWGVKFLKWEWLELSAVTIPANGEASILAVKSASTEQMAASGRSASLPASRVKTNSPISLRPKEATDMKTLAEQIAALEAKRASNATKMEEIGQKSIAEGRSMDAAEQEEFDTLLAEVEALEADITRFKSLERAKAVAAKPVGQGDRGALAAPRVPGTVKMSEDLAPGVRFARLARVKALAHRHKQDVIRIAEGLYPQDEVLNAHLKAAIGAGTTEAGSWAANLVGAETSAFADFVSYLRPRTIIGRFGQNGIPALRSVPFRVPLITETTPGSAAWVGEGNAKPVTSFGYSRTTLNPLKVAAIAVVSDELLKYSSPAADALLRDSLAEAVIARLDVDFIDPAKAASAGLSPASITNGITPIASSGNTADHVAIDVAAAFQAFANANNTLDGGVWIMNARAAIGLSVMKNALGQSEFPGMSVNGGTFMGLPVIISQYVPDITGGSYVVLAKASDIYLADEGGVEVDMSTEASLQMDTAPTMTSDSPTGASLVSLWQTNSVGFRAERTINWARRRTSAVAVISGVDWMATAS